jgi:hypothetical protein
MTIKASHLLVHTLAGRHPRKIINDPLHQLDIPPTTLMIVPAYPVPSHHRLYQDLKQVSLVKPLKWMLQLGVHQLYPGDLASLGV